MDGVLLVLFSEKKNKEKKIKSKKKKFVRQKMNPYQ